MYVQDFVEALRQTSPIPTFFVDRPKNINPLLLFESPVWNLLERNERFVVKLLDQPNALVRPNASFDRGTVTLDIG
jgi:hypothetical protein